MKFKVNLQNSCCIKNTSVASDFHCNSGYVAND